MMHLLNTLLVSGVVALAALPCALTLWNLWLYRVPPQRSDQTPTPTLTPTPAPTPAQPQDASPGLSVLIPARDEEAGIDQAVRSALEAGQGLTQPFEIIVLDDASTDTTASIVQHLAQNDPRIRLETGTPLPSNWCGKQWACWQLSHKARYDTLVWIDADVRLQPGALSHIASALHQSDAGLASGFPRQITRTLAEQLVVPQVLLVLLGYLPIWAMRRFPMTGFGAGCGQLFIASRQAYQTAGGHAAPGVRASLHDGVTLPRAFRDAGLKTDLFDATPLATVRMYRGLREVWQGFSKNASEGMATPTALPIWTILLVGGHVLPWIMLAALITGELNGYQTGVALACAFAGLTSLVAAVRFKQGLVAAVLRPLGIMMLLAIQYHAAFRRRRGQPAQWRGRSYQPSEG